MFDDFLKNCPMDDEIKPDKKRVRKNIAALKPLIEKEGGAKRGLILKPLIVAGVIAIFSAISLISVNADMRGEPVRFLIDGEEREGEYRDFVDGSGYRHFSFSGVLPIDDNYAVIFDVDAPKGENVRVITKDTDPDFLENIRLYCEASREFWNTVEETTDSSGAGIKCADPDDPAMPKHEDFGLIFKDSELCVYTYRYGNTRGGGEFGGEFMHMGAAEGKPSGNGDKKYPTTCEYDWENGNETVTYSHYYYVGKE